MFQSARLRTVAVFLAIFAARASGAESPVDATKSEIAGVVVDDNDQPVAGARVCAWFNRREQQAATDNQGQFAFETSADLEEFAIAAESADGTLQSFYQPAGEIELSGMARPTIRLCLEPAVEYQVTVLDLDERPVADVSVIVYASFAAGAIASGLTGGDGRVLLRGPANASAAALFAYRANVGADYAVLSAADLAKKRNDDASGDIGVTLKLDGAQTVQVRVIDEASRPMAGVRVFPTGLEKVGRDQSIYFSAPARHNAVSDDNGLVEFSWIPSALQNPFSIVADSQDRYAAKPAIFYPGESEEALTLRLIPKVEARGRVLFPDGRPVANALVRVSGSGNFNNFWAKAHTDETGCFSMLVHADAVFLFAVEANEWAATTSGTIAKRGEPLDVGDMTVQPGVKIYGVVSTEHDAQLQSDNPVWLSVLPENEQYEWKGPDGEKMIGAPQIILRKRTDGLGRYSFYAVPGKFTLHVASTTESRDFTIRDERELRIDFQIPKATRGAIAGKVLHKRKPVADAQVSGVSTDEASHPGFKATTGGDGRFEAEHWRNEMVVSATTPDRRLRGITKIRADQKEVTIDVEPTATVTGRLLDGLTRKPLAGRKITYGIRVYAGDDPSRGFTWEFGGSVITKEDGRFEAAGLNVGSPYELSTPDANSRSILTVTTVTPQNSELIELGDVAPPLALKLK